MRAVHVPSVSARVSKRNKNLLGRRGKIDREERVGGWGGREREGRWCRDVVVVEANVQQ
jgi:hypothetical protein